MRKFIVVSIVSIVMLTAACSSSKKDSAADPAGAATAQGKATCQSLEEIKTIGQSLGTTPAEFQAAGAKMKQVAASMKANPPGKVAGDADEAAALIDQVGTNMQKATTLAQVQSAAAVMLTTNDKAILAYGAWAKSNCK